MLQHLSQTLIHFIVVHLTNLSTAFFLFRFQVKEVFDAIAPVVGLSVGSAVGQSSIADEVSSLVRKPKQEFYPTIDEEYVQMEPQTKIDILVATPGRLCRLYVKVG